MQLCYQAFLDARNDESGEFASARPAHASVGRQWGRLTPPRGRGNGTHMLPHAPIPSPSATPNDARAVALLSRAALPTTLCPLLPCPARSLSRASGEALDFYDLEEPPSSPTTRYAARGGSAATASDAAPIAPLPRHPRGAVRASSRRSSSAAAAEPNERRVSDPAAAAADMPPRGGASAHHMVGLLRRRDPASGRFVSRWFETQVSELEAAAAAATAAASEREPDSTARPADDDVVARARECVVVVCAMMPGGGRCVARLETRRGVASRNLIARVNARPQPRSDDHSGPVARAKVQRLLSTQILSCKTRPAWS